MGDIADDIINFDFDDWYAESDGFYQPPQLKTCNLCGKTGLHWEREDGEWVLFDTSKKHKCRIIFPRIETMLNAKHLHSITDVQNAWMTGEEFISDDGACISRHTHPQDAFDVRFGNGKKKTRVKPGMVLKPSITDLVRNFKEIDHFDVMKTFEATGYWIDGRTIFKAPDRVAASLLSRLTSNGKKVKNSVDEFLVNDGVQVKSLDTFRLASPEDYFGGLAVVLDTDIAVNLRLWNLFCTWYPSADIRFSTGVCHCVKWSVNTEVVAILAGVQSE